jgi:hypothetical protein
LHLGQGNGPEDAPDHSQPGPMLQTGCSSASAGFTSADPLFTTRFLSILAKTGMESVKLSPTTHRKRQSGSSSEFIRA